MENVQKTIQDIINYRIKEKSDSIDVVILEYMNENNVTKEDLKKHGRRIIQYSTGIEMFLYKDQIICSVKRRKERC